MISQMNADRCARTSMVGLRNFVPLKPMERDLNEAMHTIAEDR